MSFLQNHAAMSRNPGLIPRSASTRCWGLVCGAFALLLLSSGQASAQLMVHPTRLVLENDQRSAQVEIINNSDAPAVYRISLVNRRMDEYGEFSPADTAVPGELFADGMLRYSPRRVVLAPGASQIIRVMVRKPAGLATGEYRSHLLFAEHLDPDARPKMAAGAAAGEIGVALTALVGVSIPVIVRQGATSAEVALGNLALIRPAGGQPAMLSLDMRRSGNQSVHGDLTVNFTPAGGTAQVIARAGGVAVYASNPLRRAKLALLPPPGTTLANGTLHVSYREPPERGGALLAEASLPLP